MATKYGGIRTVGKTAEEALSILKDMKRLEDAGAFGVEVECVAEDALIEIKKHTSLVINSLGSGSGGDVMFLFFEDICGETSEIKMPRHAKSWGNSQEIKDKLNKERSKAIKGFKDDKDGFLDFYSSKKNGVSTSKLIIDNFKVKEIPVLAKLLALASLQGIADLLTGEGIRFTDFEMNFTNENKVMRIQELYAIGPAISILLEGYIEDDKLISLRGTLVPATTINRTISSIPLIGDILVGQKVGEGVFGVSFKIKGPPKKLETTVNPIKTLTPRFITRTLEKIKN